MAPLSSKLTDAEDAGVAGDGAPTALFAAGAVPLLSLLKNDFLASSPSGMSVTDEINRQNKI